MRTAGRLSIRALALLALAALAACTGDGDGVVVVDGTTVAVEPSEAPGWLGGTGGTGAVGGTTAASGPVVQGSFNVSFPAGAARISISGYSCDVAEGSWTATVRVAEGGEGSTTFGFVMPADQDTAEVDWTFEGTWDGSPATLEHAGTVHKGGSADRPRLQFFGLLTVTRGTEVIRGPANAASVVELGVVDRCTS